MNRNSADSYIPAEVKTSLDLPPLWGRLVSLAADRAVLLSRFEIPEGKVVALTFDFGGAAFREIRARITAAARDADGYYDYELAFTDRSQSALLGSAIKRAFPPAV